MSDIKLECPHCGAFFQISEYVDTDHIACPQCDTKLEVEAAKVKESGLRVRKDSFGSGRDVVVQNEPTVKPPPKTKKELKKEAREKDKMDPYLRIAPRPWHGLVGLILGVLVFVGLQYAADEGMISAQIYSMMRIVVYPLLYLGVLVTAFREGYLPGVLCLFLPPYTIYYALSRTDAYSVRGAFAAMLIGLGAELHYMPDQAFLTHGENAINAVIEGGADAINRAGNSGVEFQ